ncbi:hypothetical protein [Parabacteroides goldsteinii]|nr:hypothetical protein [Parabacteroides goldsteinii]
MKPLILSFFAVILGYSLLFNEKEEISQIVYEVVNHKAARACNRTASVL